MSQPIPTSEVLNRAADLIEERGWVKGKGWPTEGSTSPICLEGGIVAALGKSWGGFNLEELWSCPAYIAVADHLSRNLDRTAIGRKPLEPLWGWNDARGRTASEVIEVLRATAVIAAAREEQDAAFATYAASEVSAS